MENELAVGIGWSRLESAQNPADSKTPLLAMRPGWRIGELMKLHKVSIEKLAEQTALPTSYLALIKMGMRLPDLTELRDIAAALNTSLDFLVNDELFDADKRFAPIYIYDSEILEDDDSYEYAHREWGIAQKSVDYEEKVSDIINQHQLSDNEINVLLASVYYFAERMYNKRKEK